MDRELKMKRRERVMRMRAVARKLPETVLALQDEVAELRAMIEAADPVVLANAQAEAAKAQAAADAEAKAKAEAEAEAEELAKAEAEELAKAQTEGK